MYDLSQASGFGTYVLTEQTTLSCTGGDAVGRGGNTFARSELYSDAYQSEFAACPNQNAQNCDSYALIYLDPVQGNGASQGFDSVLEETTQYINSLAVGLAFRDQLPNGQITSARDGLLAFLWYIERYLHLARTENTAAYDYIINNACWRDAILTIWGRAWLYLEATKDMRNLEIYGDQFEAALLRPELLDEIARVRAAEGCE